MMSEVEKIKAGLRKKRVTSRAVRPEDLLSTGSTLLNLACTGNWKGGFSKGKYFFVVGDSASGKTFLSWTCLAEASVNPAFDDYRLIFDDVEGGSLMSIEKFFGKKVAERVEPPERDEEGSPIYSTTIDEFYFHLDDALDAGPCLYVLDSMDGLTSDTEQSKFEEKKVATRKGKEVSGSYGDGKAKTNSGVLRQCLSKMRKNGSILLIVNQTRDNIGAGFFESKKTRSGGHALTFYAAIELWSAVAGEIKKTVRETPRTVGTKCKIRVKKNRYSGRKRIVELPIYYDYGIDDIESCVDFLVKEKQWKKVSGKIDTGKDLGDVGAMQKKKLIRTIEERGLEQNLRMLTADVWNEIEEACGEDRKPRYT